MEPTLSSSLSSTNIKLAIPTHKFLYSNSLKPHSTKLSLSSYQSTFTPSCISLSAKLKSTLSTTEPISSSSIETDNRHWMVLMDSPPHSVLNSKQETIDYYVNTLQTVLGSEKDAQMCMYDASCETHFGFCCDIDEQASLELASLPGVLSVRPDPNYNSKEKDYSSSLELSNVANLRIGITQLFPGGNTKHWLVRMDKPSFGVVTKAQMVDYYAQILAKVLGNEKDAEMCVYHVSWRSNFGFCCELDDECAQELAGVPGVLSVQPDKFYESENKDYGGINVENLVDVKDSSEASQINPVRTKKLFVTGLSFYTSEKTLRAAFEGFGELVEVKIIIDKISKRSKGYAFLEYTTEEAAHTALKEMNGKIINGWMIVVDVAKPSSPSYSRGRRRITT
ncbi:organelle RRM domain-containing protein 1, chloroplastic [Mercurialis annua]|uniref:organelle RRM domain-containing protein 1, chloroplastic n=1 Tax=Mercurialis annua TaxID=3986 RepID=UPI00216064C1|nr:organelle RRM domain-containing protein 1, chloroplastic [Mercurialis annua]